MLPPLRVLLAQTAAGAVINMAHRVLANPLAFLSHHLQILDFLVVVTSLLKAIPGLPEVSALRAFRVLRPLRSLSRIRGLRMMVKSLLSSLPALGNVGLLLCFAFGLYAILGLAVFQGLTHARCRLTLAPVAIPASHLQAWAWTGVPSAMPWVAASDYQGVLPRVSTSPLLNDTGLPPGDRAALFFEMTQRFFSGNQPEDAVYGPAAGPGASPDSQVPWQAPSPYYVDYEAATAYVSSIVNNRTAFPFCGAGQLVNALANSSTGERWASSGIPLADDSWTTESSPWTTPRMCVWLIDGNDDRVCSLSGASALPGAYTCQIDPSVDDALPLQLHPPSDAAVANATLALRFAPRTCGSSWDDFDHPRFADAGVMSYGSETYALEGGFVSFDSFPSAILLLYQ